MRREVLTAAASIVLGLSFAGHSFAQPRNMPPDPYDPQQTSAPSNNVMQAPQPALPAANDYPAAEVQAVPMARARLAVARARYDDAQTGLHQLIDNLKEDFEFSADLAAAMRTQKAAYELYTAARDRVMVQVTATDDYQTSKKLYGQVNSKLEDLKGNSAANQAEIVATARLKLAYARSLSVMESNALQADAATQDAKSRLVDATARVSDLRAAFARSLRRDPKVLAARQDFQDARVDRAAAAALFEGALEARNIAMDYAYDLHRYDPYTYRYTGNNYDPYYDSGYGYGYNYGTTIGYDPFFRNFPVRRGGNIH